MILGSWLFKTWAPKPLLAPEVSQCVKFCLRFNSQLVTKGCETVEMTLRRNGLGQLGFHVNYEGIVADVEPYGYAWQAGLRQGSRLVEICKVAVATLSHEQMIDLLRTSVTVKVVIVPPYEDCTPRRYFAVAVFALTLYLVLWEEPPQSVSLQKNVVWW